MPQVNGGAHRVSKKLQQEAGCREYATWGQVIRVWPLRQQTGRTRQDHAKRVW
jgi:hypothetical protein